MSRNEPRNELPTAAKFSQFAQLILIERMSAVLHELPLAAWFSEHSTAFVHRLRVASRRANAAFRLFEELLPRRSVARCRSRLRAVRRAAAAAREIDVLIGHLETPGPSIGVRRDPAGMPEVHAFLELVREDACSQLRAEAQDWKLSREYRRLKKLADHVRWRGAGQEPEWPEGIGRQLDQAWPGLIQHCKQYLKLPLITEDSWRSLVGPLHAWRVEAKRFRYAMELFGNERAHPCLAALTELQDRLGEINDRATAIRLLAVWNEDPRATGLHDTLESLAAAEQVALMRNISRFRRWWNPSRLGELTTTWRTIKRHRGPVTPATRPRSRG